MTQKTRRSFLAAMGVTALAGCAESGDPGAETTAGDTTTSAGGTETTTGTATTAGTTATTTQGTTDGGTTTTTDDSKTGMLVADFESLEEWVPFEEKGKITPEKKDVYRGSQSARLTAEKKDDYVGMWKAAGTGGLDLGGKNLSLAVKQLTPQMSKITLELYAPSRGNPLTMTRTITGPTDRWMRIDFGVTGAQRDPNLSKVQEIRIRGRPRDGSKPMKFLVDDLRAVDRPDKGYVLLTFDGTDRSHYEKVFPIMQEYGFPGVEGVMAKAVYQDGYLTVDMMREMRDAGWDMAAFPFTGAQAMTDFSKEEQLDRMKSCKRFLSNNGFKNGKKHFITPKNIMGPHTYNLVQKEFESAYRFGFSPNGLSLTDPHNVSRLNGRDVDASKQLVDFAATYKQATVLAFQELGEDTITEEQFRSLLEHIKSSGVKVINATDLAKMQVSVDP